MITEEEAMKRIVNDVENKVNNAKETIMAMTGGAPCNRAQRRALKFTKKGRALDKRRQEMADKIRKETYESAIGKLEKLENKMKETENNDNDA